MYLCPIFIKQMYDDLKQLLLDFRVMVKDPLHATCLPVHIGTLVELGKANGNTYID